MTPHKKKPPPSRDLCSLHPGVKMYSFIICPDGWWSCWVVIILGLHGPAGPLPFYSVWLQTTDLCLMDSAKNVGCCQVTRFVHRKVLFYEFERPLLIPFGSFLLKGQCHYSFFGIYFLLYIEIIKVYWNKNRKQPRWMWSSNAWFEISNSRYFKLD